MKIKKLLCAASVVALCFTSAACASPRENNDPETQKCEHVMSRVEHDDSTCAKSGNIAYYECDKCDKMFFDADGKIELTAENTLIAKNKHSLEHFAATEKVAEYWHCFACDGYYTDADALNETQYKTLFADYYKITRLPNISGSGNFFDASSEISPLYDDFTFRCYVSWKNESGKTYADLAPADRLQVNINLNRDGAGDRVDWYNFGIGYGKSGLFYKPVESGSIITASREISDLFIKQGGIYIVVIREGGSISAYFEKSDGKRVMFTGGNRFGARESLVRLAANAASGVDGFKISITDAAICIGVADIKCVFDG